MSVGISMIMSIVVNRLISSKSWFLFSDSLLRTSSLSTKTFELPIFRPVATTLSPPPALPLILFDANEDTLPPKGR